MPLTVLLTGSSGTVAGYLARNLREEVDLVRTVRSPRHASDLQMDIRDEQGVSQVVDREKPEIILHPAALARPDYCEAHREEAHLVNVVGTRNVVSAARRVGARLIFFSTDYVFDGRSGPYDEDRAPSPINYYGHTKARAEEAVLAVPGNAVLRLSYVYGIAGEHLASSTEDMLILDTLARGQSMELDSVAARYPVYAGDILAAVRILLGTGHAGVVHLGGPDQTTKWDFGRRLARAADLDEGRLLPRTAPSAVPRPADSRLLATRPLPGHRFTGLDTGIAASVETWKAARPSAEETAD